MDAIALLKSQHREVEGLFTKLKKANDSSSKMEIFAELADAFAAHSSIEEKIFYPAVYIGDMKEQLKQAVEEHLGAKRIFADLLDLDADNPKFEAKATVLKDEIEHHVEEEENGLFPEVRKTFERSELLELGAEMGEMFDKLLQTAPRTRIRSETGDSASLPLDVGASDSP